MLIRIGCDFEYETTEQTPSLWQVRPRSDGEHRVVSEAWVPPAPARMYLDAYGNVCDRLTLPAGRSVLRYNATVSVPSSLDKADKGAVQAPIDDLPDEAFVYLLPSRFCWPDVLHDPAWELFGSTEPGWPRVQAVCDWIHENILYEVGASTAVTTAYDVWESRTGVCRDLTQLGITLCRALNVPARYVAGYLPDIAVAPPDLPMDFCSWFEAWLDGRWWTFDPRNNEPRIGRVVIARGRDALDAAMVTTWGAAELKVMTVYADEASDAG
ncbi:MAG TPA: transglutaminase family protein [Acidimicrobiales bacterium]|jgi:transglutaminase-like putative cysteine protease|nr:transglutaminase family protein [Acidimicrobiales bacterium]